MYETFISLSVSLIWKCSNEQKDVEEAYARNVLIVSDKELTIDHVVPR